MKKKYSNIDNIIISFLEGGITSFERKILQDWLLEDVLNKNYFKQIYKIWAATDILNENSEDIDAVLERVKLQINNNTNFNKPNRTFTKKVRLNFGKWAAVLFIFLSIGALIFSGIRKQTKLTSNIPILNEIIVPLGSKSKLHLPDGTEVYLNAGSKLTYSMDYGKKTREIEFSGEAYFKVAKNKNIPFIVHTSRTNIKALGTEFNVKAYPNENIIETILVEGSVAVDKTGRNKDFKDVKNSDVIILKPGQKLQIIKDLKKNEQKKESKPLDRIESESQEEIKPIESLPKIIITSSKEVQIETSWKDKRWIIHGMNLDNLALQFSRKFNVDIQMKDSELSKYKFTGIIENETLEEVVAIMKFTIPFKCKIDKGNVTWYLDPEREKDFKEAY